MLAGTGSDDTFRPLTGIDQVDGGAGSDRLIVDYSTYQTATARFPSSLTLGADGWAGTIESRVGNDVVTAIGIERIEAVLGARDDWFIAKADTPFAARSLSLDAGGGRDLLTLNLAALSNVTFKVGSSGFVTNSLGSRFANFELFYIRVGGGTNSIVTAVGADRIEVGGGTNSVTASGGDDLIVSHGGTDRIDGGAGTDRWSIDLAGSTAATTLAFDGLAGKASAGHGIATGIERVEATLGSDNDSIKLTDAAISTVSAGGGADNFTLLRPDDVTIDGGAGVDTARIDLSGTTRFYETELHGDGAGGLAGVVGRYDGVYLSGIEALNVTLSDTDDLVTIDAAALAAGARLTMDGGVGRDLLTFDLSGLAGARAVVRADGVLPFGDSRLTGFDGFHFIGSGGNDELGGGASNVAEGGGGADILRGGAGVDHLDGGEGNDRLYSNGGADELIGGAGDDLYYVSVGGPLPTITEYTGDGYDTVYAGVSFGLSANVERLVLTGAADIAATGTDAGDVLAGNPGANLLQGLGGADSITGGDGLDSLYGGTGADILTGGAGADRFVFDTLETSAQRDTLRDFAPGEDIIELDRAVFAAFADRPLGSALPAGSFVLGTQAVDDDDHIIYDPATGSLYYDADGAGGADAVMIATLSGAPHLGAGDFILA